MENVICKRKVQVPGFLFQEMAIPELKGLDLSLIDVKTGDGSLHDIKPARSDINFVITFKNLPANKIVTLFFCHKGAAPVEAKEPVSEKAPAQAEPAEAPASEPVKKSFFQSPQRKQADRIALNKEKIEAIRNKKLDHDGLSGAKILTFDFCGCWARALGMIQKARQLHFELRTPLHDFYDRISGQGDGAIIAAAVATGIDFDRLATWWTTDWKKVHSPGKFKKLARWGKSKFKPNESGYDARQARGALKKLFTKAGADLRMRDTLTKLQITVIQADFNVSTHYSLDSPDLELYAAVEDSAVTKIHYNQKQTIKGEAVFLGAIEKNDVAGLALSPDNKKMSITSIGAPVRVNPPAALQLVKLGHAADKIALQSAGHFLNGKRAEQLIKKLAEAGYQIGYSRLECKPIDNIVCNSTDDRAMRAGIESGSGQIYTSRNAQIQEVI